MSLVSRFDPSRPTVGKLYRDLQMLSSPDRIQVGDMSNEQMKGYVEDLNEALASDPYGGNPFFITIYQKKDLQMPSAVVRKCVKTNFRPYPENDTDVFWTDPRTKEVRYCWSLPHWSEMDNVIANPDQFDEKFVWMVISWKKEDLRIFGFYNHPELKWQPHPKWKDMPIKSKPSILSCA